MTHLSEEGDWLLAHGLGIPNVGSDDLSEGFFDTLSGEKATGGYLDIHTLDSGGQAMHPEDINKQPYFEPYRV